MRLENIGKEEENIFCDSRLNFLIQFIGIEDLAFIIYNYIEDKYCHKHNCYYYDNCCFECIRFKKSDGDVSLIYKLRGNVEISINHDSTTDEVQGIIYPIHYADHTTISQLSQSTRPTIRVSISSLDVLFKDPVKTNGVKFKTRFKPGVILVVWKSQLYSLDNHNDIPADEYGDYQDNLIYHYQHQH